MIKAIDLTNARDSAVIYSSVLEQINMFVETDKDLAGELAIAAIQTVICGETNSDNPVVQAMIMPVRQSSEKNYQRYAQTCESKRTKKIMDKRLDEIADLHTQGMSERAIAAELNLKKSTVHDRLNTIYRDYPELLKESECPDCPDCPTYENENENENESVIDTESVNDTESERENESKTRTPPSRSLRSRSSLLYLP